MALLEKKKELIFGGVVTTVGSIAVLIAGLVFKNLDGEDSKPEAATVSIQVGAGGQSSYNSGSGNINITE